MGQMKVWIWPENTTEEIGSIRFQVEWWTVIENKKHMYSDDIDFDSDLESNVLHYPDRIIAIRQAKKVAKDSFFGIAQVRMQRVGLMDDWEDKGEWQDIGEMEEIQ